VVVDDGWLSLEVSDQGAGMSTEELEHAKDPFFTTKEPGRGTGLGLSISESIVRAHGGELLLHCSPGKGTDAAVRIPIAKAQQPSEHAHGQA